MNILQLCLSSGLGGLELYVFRASAALAKDHKVCAVLQAGSKLDDYYREHASIERLHLEHSRNPVPLLNARRLAKIIDKNNIDLVHMHWGKDMALAAFAKALSKRKPKLAYTRQMMITRHKNDFYHRFLYGQLDLLLTITRQLENLCKRYITAPNLKIQTLYYGVDEPTQLLTDEQVTSMRVEKGLSPDDFVVGLFGRLEDGKGQHLLIKATAEAHAQGKNIKALIVGHEMDAGYREQLVRLAESLKVKQHIVFNDFVNNPQQLMQICDCLCLTTYEETFGLVLPEAMRAGVAVIGSDSGGVPEIIDHQQTGLLFETKNADSLYQQIAWYYDDAGRRQKIAEQGKVKAGNMFDTEVHFSELESILTELTGS